SSDLTASMIIGTTAEYYGISMDELTGTSRSRVYVTARQIAMYLCRQLTDLSLPKIGEHFGGKDHTTVMYAVKKIEEQMGQRRQTYNQVNEIHGRIKQRSRGGGFTKLSATRRCDTPFTPVDNFVDVRGITLSSLGTACELLPDAG